MDPHFFIGPPPPIPPTPPPPPPYPLQSFIFILFLPTFFYRGAPHSAKAGGINSKNIFFQNYFLNFLGGLNVRILCGERGYI